MNKVYEMVQQRIIKDLEKCLTEGTKLPWIKPWTSLNAPMNYISKKKYRGINTLLLDKGGYYLTFKQIQELSKKHDFLKLKKGSKSSMVVFWTFKEKTVKDEKVSDEENLVADNKESTKRVPIFRYYNVFHESQIEGFEQILTEEEIAIRNPVDDIQELNTLADTFISDYSEKVCPISMIDCDRAFYSPSKDTITIPPKYCYENTAEYYSTAFHEMAHSTGHSSRLNRPSLTDLTTFGDEKYSKEELVAEISSSMLMNEFNLECKQTIENSNAYILGWLSKIKSDITLITFAAQQAQKACDYMIESSKIYTQDTEESNIA